MFGLILNMTSLINYFQIRANTNKETNKKAIIEETDLQGRFQTSLCVLECAFFEPCNDSQYTVWLQQPSPKSSSNPQIQFLLPPRYWVPLHILPHLQPPHDSPYIPLFFSVSPDDFLPKNQKIFLSMLSEIPFCDVSRR